MNAKAWVAKLEKVGSLSQIIWTFLGILLFVYILLTFSDSIFSNNDKVLNWGKIDLKSQLP